MAEIVLPTQRNTVIRKSPRKLVIYSPPKTGKTTLVAGLDNCLVLDAEKGSDFVPAMAIQIDDYIHLNDVCEKIKSAGRPYKYGALDSGTELETMIMPLALKLYQQTPMGANYKGQILNLPNGGGYYYLRLAYDMMIEKIDAAFERTIVLCHLKDKIINKADKEVAAKDIDLTGKIKNILCKDADAIGYLYRQDNKCIISFETSDIVTCGARPEHLRNRSFVLSEQHQDGTISTYWDRIYID